MVQDTLDVCTEAHVTRMEQALDLIYRRHSPAYRHDYQGAWQLLAVDMSGIPCGPKAAFATKGYSPSNPTGGGQLGRVLASGYGAKLWARRRARHGPRDGHCPLEEAIAEALGTTTAVR